MSYLSPVRIKNPTMQNTLLLHPKQEFQIVLDGEGHAQEKVEYDPLFFKCENVNHFDSRTIYDFSQLHDLSLWTIKSRAFVGEIIIRDSKNKISGTVCAYIDCSVKSNQHITTIINPKDLIHIKISPSTTAVLEVIIYDYTGKESWSPHVIGTVDGFSFDLIKQDKLVITNPDGSVNDFKSMVSSLEEIYTSVPRCFTVNDSKGLPKHEIHYWYRIIDPKNRINSVQTGLYSGCKIIFDAARSTSFKSIVVDFNIKKQKQKVQIVNGVAQVGKSSSYIDQSNKLLNKDKKSQDKDYDKDYDYETGWYGEGYHPAHYLTSSGYNSTNNYNKSSSKSSYYRANIEIEVNEDCSLSGENVIYFR